MIELAPRNGQRSARTLSRSRAWACAISAIVGARRVEAAPQLSSTLSIGAAGNGDRSQIWSSTDFAAGLRGEVLFGRSRDADFGVGPYIETLTTTGFSDVQLGTGVTWLVPVHPYLPVTLSAGGYAARTEARGWQPGLAAELFWGSHGYNYDSLYALSAGVFVGVRYGVDASRDVAVLVGARLDLELIALPFVLVWNAIRGGDPTR
jgi:hypothetical protein